MHENLKIGNVVVPTTPGFYLCSGSEVYGCAIVIQLKPTLVLVSEFADMRWEMTVQDIEFKAMEQASPALFEKCLTRGNRYESFAEAHYMCEMEDGSTQSIVMDIHNSTPPTGFDNFILAILKVEKATNKIVKNISFANDIGNVIVKAASHSRKEVEEGFKNFYVLQ